MDYHLVFILIIYIELGMDFLPKFRLIFFALIADYCKIASI